MNGTSPTGNEPAPEPASAQPGAGATPPTSPAAQPASAPSPGTARSASKHRFLPGRGKASASSAPGGPRAPTANGSSGAARGGAKAWRPSAATVAACAAIALTVALGVVLRMAVVGESDVIPAEDPYTHMALVREHLADGSMDPLNAGGELYPPGMHAFLAAFWSLTGVELYDLVLFGPVLFGAIGIVGMAFLLWRSDGPTAAVVGALALAVAPEAIFRTTMMAPTAFDLAVLPFFLYALVRVVRGELQWGFVAAPMGLYVVYAHPWLLAILSGAGLLYAAFSLLFVQPATGRRNATFRGTALAVAIIGGSLGIAALEPRFFEVFLPPGMADTSLAPMLLVGTLAVAAALWFTPRSWDARLVEQRRPLHWLGRLAVSGVLAVALWLVTMPALAQGMPIDVDLPLMFGEPILALAALGFILLPFLASPAANLGAAIAATTYPFVIYNPLASPFWPHRTAVFLGVGLVLLAGAAAAGLVRGVVAAVAWLATRRARKPARASAPGSGTPSARPRPALLAVPALLLTTLLASAVYAGTPDSYSGGWYHLYHQCEMDGLRAVADKASEQDDAIVITGDWQAKLVVAALSTNASRVWYKPDFFQSQERRDDLVAQMARQGRPIYVVLDRYIKQETDGADTSFADSPPWQPMGTWCTDTGQVMAPLRAVATNGGNQ